MSVRALKDSNSKVQAVRNTNPTPSKQEQYGAFDQLDGSHPWQTAIPEGCVLYPVEHVTSSEVLYFNFQLAKEMGLIPEHHPHQLNPQLIDKLKKTFSLRILNEYDQKRFGDKGIEKRRAPSKKLHMATRYLQLQHQNKQGKTSGDGRSIWNGVVNYNGRAWDVSSRGTGVTQLSPGASLAQKNLKTGDRSFGYGCGLADVDELLSSAIMSEIFYRQGLQTERVLVVFDLGKGCGIGVRSGENLIRPAHMFLYLKQENHSALQRTLNLFIQRQIKNGTWKLKSPHQLSYDDLLERITFGFAEFVARLEIDFIFVWIDWDGDNILADAGIIDYGSVRRFGLRHDQYRYDDVERFSTTMNEQVRKMRGLIQVFCQMIDFLKTKQKRQLSDYKNHKMLRAFDQRVAFVKRDLQLQRWSCPRDISEVRSTLYDQLLNQFRCTEKQKSQQKPMQVSDGINSQPLYHSGRLFEALLDSYSDNARTDLEQIHFFAKANDVKGRSARLSPSRKRTLKRLVTIAHKFFESLKLSSRELTTWKKALATTNQATLLTGNGLILTVEHLLKLKKERSHNEMQELLEVFIDQFADSQVKSGPKFNLTSNMEKDLLDLLEIAQNHAEDI